MTCEGATALLPDYVLGTMAKSDQAEVRAHLRGCSVCRRQAAELEEGVATFARAAHHVDPPPDLRDRVMGVLGEEWAERPAPPPFWSGGRFRSLALVAAATVLAGTVAWGVVGQLRGDRNAADAAAYREFLAVLGGTDVRVAALEAVGGSGVEGSVLVYDSTVEQSWALILVRAPGFRGTLHAALSTPAGRTIDLFPMELDMGGEGDTWLVTSSNISRFDAVRVTTEDGILVARGQVRGHE